MRRCNWCERWFRNKQSVRSHLKWCGNWKAAKAAGHYPAKVLVDAYKCGTCWVGPAPGGHPGTLADVNSTGGFCTTCNAPGNWVVVGKRSLGVEEAARAGLNPS